MIQGDQTQLSDTLAARFQIFAQYILIGVFGLLPLIFAPSAMVPLEYTKTLIITVGLFAALVLLCLSVLRSGKLTLGVSYTLIAFWVLLVAAWVSALFSGDIMDAMVGDTMGIHTVGFVGLLALTMTLWTFLGFDRTIVMRLYVLLAFSTIVLAILHLIRLFFGVDVLSFGVLSTNTATVIGSWNDLALYFGLTILLSLLTLEQIPLATVGRVIFGFVLFVSLLMLAVINFYSIWLVLGLISFVMVVYSLSKHRFSGTQRPLIRQKENSSSLVLSLVVCAVSLFFITGGSTLGGKMSELTGISYVEVRPSFEATIGILKGVYEHDALLGVGPNRFADAWRLHKNEAINQTIFWNTDFNAGNGYIPTFLVTTGAIGSIAWILFLVSFLWFGIRGLVRTVGGDKQWHYIGLSSFIGALYIWSVALVYVPGMAILLIGALCTGITIAAERALRVEGIRTWDLHTTQKTGFVVTLGIIAVIITSVHFLYTSGKHYLAAYTFNAATTLAEQGGEVQRIESGLINAYDLRQNDLYARRVSEYQFSRLNALLSLREPTEEQKTEFKDTITNAISAGILATELDGTDPVNWATLGGVYSLLVTANIEGSYEKAQESLSKAREFDPHNPARALALAELEARSGKVDVARTYAEEAIAKKMNYSDALFFLSQLDIGSGNVESAIRYTEAVIALEPGNAARHYQLGVLNTALGKTEAAVRAFESAIKIDESYANARYLLAFAYDSLGRTDDARAQFTRVLELNPGNADVESLIQMLDTEGTLKGISTGMDAAPTLSNDAVSTDASAVITTEDPDSALISPVNVVPGSPDRQTP